MTSARRLASAEATLPAAKRPVSAEDNAPSAKRIAFAEEIAAAMGQELPEACRIDWRACADFIDQNKETVARPPSDKQLAFARKIAEAMGVDLPEQAKLSGNACSAFIETNKAALPAGGGAGATGGDGKPSDKALSFAEKIAKTLDIPLPASVRADRVVCSKFIDEHRAKLPVRAAS